MKSKFNALICIILTVMFMLSFVACGTQSDKVGSTQTESSAKTSAPAESAQPEKKEVITLSVLMQTEKDTTGWQAVVKDLEAKTDKLGIKLEIEKFPGNDSISIFRARFATANIPDILIYNSAVGAKADLKSEFVDISGDWTKNYDANILKSGYYSIDGKLVAVPLGGTNLDVVMYNKKVFSDLDLQIPNNWNELLAVCEKIKAAGIVPMYISGKDGWTLQLLPFLGAHRDANAAGKSTGDVMKEIHSRKLKWTDMKLFIDSMAKLKGIKDKGYANKNVISDTYDAAQKALAEGTAAMYVMGGWVNDELLKKYPDKINDIGSFALNFDDNTDKICAFLPPAVMIPTSSENKNVDAAKDFINYFASSETQTIYFHENPGIPCIDGIQGITLTPAQEDMYKLMQSGRVEDIWQSDYSPYSAGDISKFLQDLMVGSKTPEQVATAMQDEMEKDAKAKGYPGF